MSAPLGTAHAPRSIPIVAPRRHPVTLNVRITHRCNADCQYCSSATETDGVPYMRADNYRQILDFVSRYWASQGVTPSSVTVQYIGGEVLTVPADELRQVVEVARQHFGERGIALVDGAQSNLIGAQSRIDSLRDLFGHRVGTSIDNFTSLRTLAGSARRYQIAFKRRYDAVAGEGLKPSGVVVVDRHTVGHLLSEALIANREYYHLNFRPVYPGASRVQPADEVQIRAAYREVFHRWAMKMRIVVEPFYGMLRRRLAARDIGASVTTPSCHFQRDCAYRHLHAEPTGDIYLCMEMQDMQKPRLGNALTGEMDTALLASYHARADRILAHCSGCAYFAQCQGGCMAESLAAGGGMFDRTYLCETWKALFSDMDALLDAQEPDAVRAWLDRLEDEYSERVRRVAHA